MEELATSREFLLFLGIKEPDRRLGHHELILRFFALRHKLNDYRPPLKKLLSDFMNEHRKMDLSQIELFRTDFTKAWKNVNMVFSGIAFRRARIGKDQKAILDNAINRAVYDIQMFSLKDFEEEVLKAKRGEIMKAFISLCLTNKDFLDSVSYATANRQKFYTRLFLWAKELEKLELYVKYLDQIPADVKL